MVVKGPKDNTVNRWNIGIDPNVQFIYYIIFFWGGGAYE